MQSIVVSALLTICHYVGCHSQKFPMSSPFRSFPNLARSAENRYTIPRQGINPDNYHNEIGDRDVDESPKLPDLNAYMMMDTTQNLHRPKLWPHGKNENQLQRQRSKGHHRVRKSKPRSRAPHLGKILKWIVEDIPELDEIEIDLPSPNILPLPQFPRRANYRNYNINVPWRTSMRYVIKKIQDVKQNILELEGYVMECLGIA